MYSNHISECKGSLKVDGTDAGCRSCTGMVVGDRARSIYVVREHANLNYFARMKLDMQTWFMPHTIELAGPIPVLDPLRLQFHVEGKHHLSQGNAQFKIC